MPASELDQLSINTVRTLAMDAVQKADSGHPGTPMALAPLAYVLWQRHLKYNPANPDWTDRDRFVLSCGHACMLLYSVLYLTGYDLSLDEIKQFRQWGSRTPGHTEHGVTPGVEATTGPLGQGTGNAVGMAIAEAQRAPLGAEEGKATKQTLGWPSLEPFYVPADALEQWRHAKDRGERLERDWKKKWDAYRAAHPDLAAELERRLDGRLPAGWDAALPAFGPQDAQATRAASGKVLNEIAAKVPELIVGSADLTGSKNTGIKDGG